MENLSFFIHEELFVVDTPEASIKMTTEKQKITLAVITNSTNEDDKRLVDDILKATKIDPSRISFQEELSDVSDRWLIFTEGLNIGGNRLIPTKKVDMNAKIVILAHPLKVLRGSKADKGALWLILKEEFGL